MVVKLLCWPACTTIYYHTLCNLKGPSTGSFHQPVPDSLDWHTLDLTTSYTKRQSTLHGRKRSEHLPKFCCGRRSRSALAQRRQPAQVTFSHCQEAAVRVLSTGYLSSPTNQNPTCASSSVATTTAAKQPVRRAQACILQLHWARKFCPKRVQSVC